MEDNDYLSGVANHLSKSHLDTIKSRSSKKNSNSYEDFKYIGGHDDSEEEEDYKKLLSLQADRRGNLLDDVFDESNGDNSDRISMEIPTLERDSVCRSSKFNKFTDVP